MTVLALDLAKCTGWARSTGHAPVISKRVFEGRRALADFRVWLNGEVVAHRIETLAIEGLFVGINSQSALTLAYMHGVAHEVAQGRNLRVIVMTAGEWRNHFLGRVSPPKGLTASRRRTWLKKQARAMCERKGWLVRTDDEADAAGILDYALAKLDPHYGVASAPLFDQMGAI
jgi:Holliday junction resolvasome RuvABC endonuclease subunit